MRSITSRDVALRASIFIASLYALCYSILIWWLDVDPLGLLIALALFAGSYFIIYLFTERFIYRKIKTIYRTIYLFQQGSSTPKSPDPHTSTSEDALSKVNRDVMDWAENKLNEVQSLKKQDTFRREFIGNLAHELKTPLTNIQGYILTLLEGALEDPVNNRKFLQKAADGVDRISALIEDLDAITKIEAGNFELNQERVDITQLIGDVFDSLERMASKRSISFQKHPSLDKPAFVNADKLRIFQVVTNLAVNAIKYGQEGGFVKARLTDLDDKLLIEVIDNGVGIDQGDLPRIFERFYRVDRSRDRHKGGTGLGLAIVKHLVDAHGQTISVNSEAGQGSAFSFTLQKA